MATTRKHRNKTLKNPSHYGMSRGLTPRVQDFLNNIFNTYPGTYTSHQAEFSRFVRQAAHKDMGAEIPTWLASAMDILPSISSWTDQMASEYIWEPGMVAFLLSKMSDFDIKRFPDIPCDFYQEGRVVAQYGCPHQFSALIKNIEIYAKPREIHDFWHGVKEVITPEKVYATYPSGCFYTSQHDVCLLQLSYLYNQAEISEDKYLFGLTPAVLYNVWNKNPEKIVDAITYHIGTQHRQWLHHPETKAFLAKIAPEWAEKGAPNWDWMEYTVVHVSDWIDADRTILDDIPMFIFETMPIGLYQKFMGHLQLDWLPASSAWFASCDPEMPLKMLRNVETHQEMELFGL